MFNHSRDIAPSSPWKAKEESTHNTHMCGNARGQNSTINGSSETFLFLNPRQHHETLVPPNKIDPQDVTLIPRDKTLVSNEETLIPPAETLVPTNKIDPQGVNLITRDETLISKNEILSGTTGESNLTERDSALIPQDETLILQGETPIPVLSNPTPTLLIYTLYLSWSCLLGFLLHWYTLNSMNTYAVTCESTQLAYVERVVYKYIFQ